MSRLQTFIKTRQNCSEHQNNGDHILLMAHVIYGYPNVEASLDIMKALLQQGVAILEVQFPFSDPVADGSVITSACHTALETDEANKPKFSKYLEHINQLAIEHPQSQILIMSYLNPLLQYGINRVAEDAPAVTGAIIPDLPIEQSQLVNPLIKADISPIWLAIPTMDESRLKKTVGEAHGMLYCVSRKGVTGQTSPLDDLTEYLNSIKALTDIPLGVGFGISTPDDIQQLKGSADIAIVGSALLNAYNEDGIDNLINLYSLLAEAAA